jgi:signal transduction histidine kinase
MHQRGWPRSVLGALGHGAVGFLFGVLILHPFSMIIFRYLDPRLAHGMGRHVAQGSWVTSIAHSFNFEMAPMGLVFGLFSSAIALIGGYYRAHLARQRDQLAAQAALLIEKNEQLVKLEASKRRHTQFMVHDFKGHLSIITGFVEHLLDQEEFHWPRASLEALRAIRRQSLRMAGAVIDLLEFSRLKESPTLQRETADVSQLLVSAASDLSLPTGAGWVEVAPIRAECPYVAMDKRLIRRVLVNLALNALKHNPGQTHVTLAARYVPESGEIEITCTDDGRGLSDQALASLFKEYGTAEDTGCEDSTGLGLAFCKTAVEAHGGRIWCDNLTGMGARFSFTIPVEPRGTSNGDTREANSGRGRRARLRRLPEDDLRGGRLHGHDGFGWSRGALARAGDAAGPRDAGHPDAAEDRSPLLPADEV